MVILELIKKGFISQLCMKGKVIVNRIRYEAAAPFSGFRLQEQGGIRLTEDGNLRILE